MAPRAVVVGPPGAGKTTIGRLLAQQLEVDFRDTDEDVVRTSGRAIADIFASDGEPAFRAMEEAAVETALREHDGVLALGGGAVLSERTRELLAGHQVVFLSVGLAEGAKRVGLSTARPLLAGVNPRATFKALLDARVPIYRSVAAVEIATDHVAPDEVVAQVVAALSART
ncbi:shikimate kinase [Saccharopolyspora antimicrobica]|uniref:Shikimate kinase n=1 Tax=Saccharopolyspora antimicrobica TaxID=455193 RepID=A0A1I5BF78_9PSEU|nr:shikimate kinase [Saccharopolyspora antimicrobica]RKT86592.1 shikimate kinase [Saccharopolyspora antimicrobica]SFN73393.1 shikimate kinase [Saccharopolyspora antimicrobica]